MLQCGKGVHRADMTKDLGVMLSAYLCLHMLLGG